VVGIGFDHDVLESAGIEQADALAAVTASDEANVVTARIARQIYRVPKVVARLYDPAQAEAYNRLGLENIAPVSWGIHRIADLLSQSNLDVEMSLGSGDVNLVVVNAPILLNGKTVNTITAMGEVHVVAISRSGKTFLPTLGTVFKAGDQIHLAVLATSMDLLDRLLNQAGG
jgi:trk system potassium uptake protein TrkA